MPDNGALLRTAYRQNGYVTAQQAAAHGFSRQLRHHHYRRGAWRHVDRALYRVLEVPEHPDEAVTRVYLLARDGTGRPAGVVSHESALYLHGMVTRPPDVVHISVDRSSPVREIDGARVFRRIVGRTVGRALPGRSPPLPSESVVDHGALRVTAPLRTVLDCIAWGLNPDLVTAFERGLRHDLLDVDACLGAVDDLLRLHGLKLLHALAAALSARHRTINRDLATVRDRLASAGGYGRVR